MDTIQETLATFITTQILRQPERIIDPSEKIISTGLIDSFNLVDLSIYIEEVFGVLIQDNELTATTFDTLTEPVEQIRQRVTRGSDITLRLVKLVERGWLLKTSSGKVARSANREKYLSEDQG